MRSRLGRRSGAAAAIVLASLVAMPASPAAADPVIVRPAADATLDTATVTVTGNASAESSLGLPLAMLESVTLTIGEKTVTSPGCSGKASCEFTGTFTLPLNGPYTVDVAARASGLLPSEATRASRSFFVAAPPAKPVMDPPRVSEARTVELSWSRNTEPDMLHYEVTRTVPGGKKSDPVTVRQPATGGRVTLSDTTTSALDGATYSYQVEAVRKGATAGSPTRSGASGAVSATVPAAPTTTSLTTTPNAPGAPAGAPTTTARPAPPGGVDLSGFLSSRSQPIRLPTITIPEPPDTGFSGSLPFGSRPPGDELEEGEADAVPPRDRTSGSTISISAGRPLVPLAGGLVLLLLALHMRLLGRRVKTMPDGDLPVDLAPIAATADPASEARPRTAVYDVMAGVDDEWAPARTAVRPAPVAVEDGFEPGAAPATFAAEFGGEFEAEPEPVAATPEREPEPVAVAWEPEPEPEPVAPGWEPEPEIMTLWAPPPVAEEPVPEEPDPDEIQVVEVVSSSRRRLERAGHR